MKKTKKDRLSVPKGLRFSPSLLAEIEAHAAKMAAMTQCEIDFSAAIRSLLRIGLNEVSKRGVV